MRQDAPADDVPEETPETEPPYYTITLPWYEDVVYMVDEGRVYHPENERPKDKDIILRYQADEKVEFAFTPYEDVIVTEAHLRNGKKEDFAFDTDEYGKVSFLMADQDLFFSLATEKRAPAPDVTEAAQEDAAQEDSGNVSSLPESEMSYAEGNEFDPYQDDVSVEDTVWEVKQKVSGQFLKEETAKEFAAVRTYTETCRKNGINEYEALERLMAGNPCTMQETLAGVT